MCLCDVDVDVARADEVSEEGGGGEGDQRGVSYGDQASDKIVGHSCLFQ